jgi:hypothetical protein
MKPKLESLLSEATVSVPQAGAVMGLGRNASYTAARRGEIPVLTFGNRLRVPTARLRKMLLEGVQDRPAGNRPTPQSSTDRIQPQRDRGQAKF